MRKIFVKRFNELIDESSLSIDEISMILNTNKDNIYHWKPNSYKYLPSLKNIIAIADLFKCSLDYLVGANNNYAEIEPNKNRQPLSKNLKAIMEEKHTNVYRLSEQINLATTNQMYKWLKGIETPQIETIVKLAKALECPVDYLVGR